MTGSARLLPGFILFDQWFVRVSPSAYPQFRRTCAGVPVIALLASLLTFKSFRLLGLEEVSTALIAVQLGLAVLSNRTLGLVFVSRGSLSCLAGKFVFGLQCPVAAWLVP